MRSYNIVSVCALLIALVVICSAPGYAVPVKYKSAGTYTDSSGGQHPWSINDSHTLLWDGQPFIPVGGAFVSRYIALGATDENYKADVAALDEIKARGITDIILKSTGPITDTDPAAWQRIIDYLEANGFTYGIEMNDGPKQPLSGYVIAPNGHMLAGPRPETQFTWDWPDVDSAIWVVMRRFDLSLKNTGGAVVKEGKVHIYLSEPLATGEVLVVYPHKTYKPVAEGGIGDIWSGFGEFRDRTLAFYKNLKFGPGLRFFLEPFTSKMDFTDDMLGFVPDSAGFRLGFEAFLTKRHVHEGAVNAAWGLNENLDKVEVAARLVPLWTSKGGVSFAYDRPTGEMYPIDTTVTQLWIDLVNYRDASAQEYMNAISDALKKQVANVPVIFKNSRHHRIYANPFGIGGFDGLGAQAYGTGDVPVTTVAGPAYALAEESAKSTWFIVAGTSTSDDNKTFIGYPNQNAMLAALDFFREVGCKGFYVDSLQALPEVTRGNYSLLADAQQLDWLKSFKDKINGSWTDFKPNVVWYPVNGATGAYVKRLGRDAWWLPTLRNGKTTYIGDGLSAYTLAGEDRVYLWSGSGDRTISLKTPPSGMPTVVFPDDVKLTTKKGGQFSLVLGESPTVLRGMDVKQVFPYETTELQMEQLAALIPLADKQGLNVQQERAGLDRAKTVLKNDQALIAHGIAQKCTDDLLKQLGADMWVEGEQPSFYYFGAPVSLPGASEGRVLLLDTDQDAPMNPYQLTYRFNPPVNASYEIWLAGTPPSEGSPLSYSVDDVNWSPVTPEGSTLQNYAPGLAWYKIGSVNVFPGNQTLQFRVDGRRSQDNRYYFAIDAVVLSPKGFTPNGVMKPF